MREELYLDPKDLESEISQIKSSPVCVYSLPFILLFILITDIGLKDRRKGMVNSKNMSSFKLQFNWKEFYFTQELCFSSLRVPRWKCHLTKSVMDNKKAWKEGKRKLERGCRWDSKELDKSSERSRFHVSEHEFASSAFWLEIYLMSEACIFCSKSSVTMASDIYDNVFKSHANHLYTSYTSKLMCMTTTWISSMKDNLILYHPPASNLRLFTFLLISMYNALHNVW